MKTSMVLNAQSGTLRGLDVRRFAVSLRERFAAAGHEIVSLSPSDRPIDESLKRAAAEESGCLLVAGGDGSVSAAAALAWESGKVLAVLPGGTMNFYARTLGLPLDIDECIGALANGRVVAADIATANGAPFVHQFSVGMHAQAVRLRQEMRYGSRLGKLVATAKAFSKALLYPVSFRVRISTDGAESDVERLSALSVSNNLFGEGHMPFADDPAGGTLGVYRGRAASVGQAVAMIVAVMRGTTRHSENISLDRATRVELRFLPHRRRQSALLDGELIGLDERVEIVIHPGALRVLLPLETDADDASIPAGRTSRALPPLPDTSTTRPDP